MVETAAPGLKGSKAHGLEVALTMLFPEPPGIGVSVKGQEQRTNRVGHGFIPPLRPLMTREADPCRGAMKRRLRISLCGVRLLAGMPGQQGVAVGSFGGLHCCGA